MSLLDDMRNLLAGYAKIELEVAKMDMIEVGDEFPVDLPEKAQFKFTTGNKKNRKGFRVMAVLVEREY